MDSGGNNSQSYVADHSAFTFYTRSSSTATIFDQNLFLVMPFGNVGIGTTKQ